MTFVRFSAESSALPKRTMTEPLGYDGFLGAGGVVTTGVVTGDDGAGADGEDTGVLVCCFGCVFLTAAAFFAFLTFLGCLTASGVNGSLRAPSTRRRRERSAVDAFATTGVASASSFFAVSAGADVLGSGGGTAALRDGRIGTAARAATSSTATGHSRRRTSWRQVVVRAFIALLRQSRWSWNPATRASTACWRSRPTRKRRPRS